MDPVSCLYNFLSIGILCYFVIICFLIKKCCMNCGTNCAAEDENLCKCYQKIYDGEITPSNHVIVRDGNDKLPISFLLNQQEDNEGEYVLGEDGILYRNEACKECCLGDDISRSSCNSHEDVFVIRTSRKGGECSPCSPSALGLGEGSFKRTASGRSIPTGVCAPTSAYGAETAMSSAYSTGTTLRSDQEGSPQTFSDVSELKGVINYGHPPTTRRVSQGVEFHTELSEHVFIVEGSVGSSEASQKAGRTSNTSCGSRTSHDGGPGSPGSCGSPGSRVSCGSHISKKSGGGGSVDSKKSCVISCPSAKSSKSSPTLASDKAAGSHVGGALGKETSPMSKGSRGGRGSACSSLGRPCPSLGRSSGSPSQAQSLKSGIAGAEASGLDADGTSMYGDKSGGASMYGKDADGTSTYGPNADLASVPGAGGSIQDAKSDGTSVRGAMPDESSIYSTKSGAASQYSTKPDAASLYSARSAGLKSEVPSAKSDGTSVYGTKSDATSVYGPGLRDTDSHRTNISEAISSRKGLDGDLSGDQSLASSGVYGDSPGKTGTGDPSKPSKSSSCVPPCGTLGPRTVKTSKSSTFKGLPCGSPGSPCSHKDRSGASSPRKQPGYDRDKSPTSDRKGSSTTSGGQSPISPSSKSEGPSPSPYSPDVMSPASSPSPNEKRGGKCTKETCGSSGKLQKSPVEKSRSPILKNPEDSASPPRDGVASPRVSIKDKFDIITPEGITSAPTFRKDECDPCPFTGKSTGAGEASPCSPNRRNVVLSDEYKDNISNKRKADKISADYKDSAADNSRGAKSARFSDRCNSTTCSSRVSSSKSCSKCSKGNKSWASSSTPQSSAVSATPDFSSTKCSKCSSDTRVSSSITSTSTKTRPSGTGTGTGTGTNSLCETTCKTKSGANSSYLNSPNAKSNFPSVTTADIDDFRDISPNRSRCENLGAALARSSCGEIRKARKEATCAAIKDPSKNVICENQGSSPDAECSAIRQLMENPNCPSIVEIIKTVDQMGEAGNEATPGSGYRSEMSRPGTSTTVDATVIHEISTKVQCCLQHARAIAAKMGGGSSECRKTMRVTATSRGLAQAQTVKVNSNIMLNTKGITINEYNKVDKPFGKNPGIQVKMRNADGNFEQFKKSYAELMTADGGAINIRIRSPCKTTPGKMLCVSTKNNPCCSDSTTNNTTSSTQPTTSSQGRTPNKVRYEDTSEDADAEKGQPSSQEYSSQDEPADSKGAVVVYKREPGQREKSSKGECSPDCTNCKRRSCPTSKYYKGRKKPGKLQVYNVTTSHFSQLNHGYRSPYIKGMPVIDSRIYEQYIHPERYRAGETYLKRRREMIQKIKGKCPWL